MSIRPLETPGVEGKKGNFLVVLRVEKHYEKKHFLLIFWGFQTFPRSCPSWVDPQLQKSNPYHHKKATWGIFWANSPSFPFVYQYFLIGSCKLYHGIFPACHDYGELAQKGKMGCFIWIFFFLRYFSGLSHLHPSCTHAWINHFSGVTF